MFRFVKSKLEMLTASIFDWRIDILTKQLPNLRWKMFHHGWDRTNKFRIYAIVLPFELSWLFDSVELCLCSDIDTHSLHHLH